MLWLFVLLVFFLPFFPSFSGWGGFACLVWIFFVCFDLVWGFRLFIYLFWEGMGWLVLFLVSFVFSVFVVLFYYFFFFFFLGYDHTCQKVKPYDPDL